MVRSEHARPGAGGGQDVQVSALKNNITFFLGSRSRSNQVYPTLINSPRRSRPVSRRSDEFPESRFRRTFIVAENAPCLSRPPDRAALPCGRVSWAIRVVSGSYDARPAPSDGVLEIRTWMGFRRRGGESTPTDNGLLGSASRRLSLRRKAIRH